MIHIKTFESYKENDIFNPQEGDYVIVNPEPGYHMPYVIDKIGRVTNKSATQKRDTLFNAMYGSSKIRFINKRWVIFCSPSKEDAEAYLTAKNYNL